MTSVDSQNIPCFPGATPRCPGQRSIQRKCFMAAITTGVVLLRWQLLSAVLMFLASTLNIRFRKS
ncbi:YjcB family protein, partial [Salmonella enterica]|uniref:YjcB family protein n=1 Tax=Salmonella enterica TaxID=28901 RepID=UPI0020CB4340